MNLLHRSEDAITVHTTALLINLFLPLWPYRRRVRRMTGGVSSETLNLCLTLNPPHHLWVCTARSSGLRVIPMGGIGTGDLSA